MLTLATSHANLECRQVADTQHKSCHADLQRCDSFKTDLDLQQTDKIKAEPLPVAEIFLHVSGPFIQIGTGRCASF